MRRISRIVLAVLCCMLLATTVYAENSATAVENYSAVSVDGSCQVTLTLKVKLDTAASGLTFPLPLNAKDVTKDGASVRTYKSGDVIMADLSNLDGLIGEYQMTFHYTLTNAVTYVEEKMMLQVPLLSGFSYPVDSLTFTITLPSDATHEPTFYSGYLQQSVESTLKSINTGKTITGYTTQQLNDHETLYMSMEVTKEMFPSVTIIQREGNPEVIPMAICAVLALVYWIATLRTAPIIRQHRTIPLEGVTAGEMGSRLTMAGGDLTMMVFTWATMGYIHIHVDKRGRVMLYKRMEMGNERGPYENRCFQSLFGKRQVVDATGTQYARLCRKAAQTVPGIQEMYRRSAGNVKLFRIVSAGVSLFSGVCLAMNMTTIAFLQIVLVIILAALGAVTAWNIQEGAYRIHIRGKLPLYVAYACALVWILLGVLAGQVLIAVLAVLMQIAAGFLAAYGGRRSDLGRYSASQVLGLRYYLKHAANQELRRVTAYNPEYFFEMVPYAIALGVDGAFAKQFGRIPQPDCPYLTTERKAKRTTEEWTLLLRKTADMMDKRQRQMQLEKWIVFTIRKR